jgi:HEAT repeat protein
MPHPIRTLALVVGLAVTGCSRPAAPLTAGGRPVAHWLDELKKPDPKARKKAVRELGHIGKADPAAIPAVVGAVKDKDAAVRQEACLALLNLGPDAAEADDALTEATRDPDAKVREYAAEALAKVRGHR